MSMNPEQILYTLLRAAILEKSVRIGTPEEFEKDLQAVAQKTGVDPEDLRAVVVPVMRELFEKMVSPLAPKTEAEKKLQPGIPAPGGPFAPADSSTPGVPVPSGSSGVNPED